MISIVDIGLCNVGSVRNMLRRIGVLAEIAESPNQLETSDAVILPGVGHFAEAMRRMRDSGFDRAVVEAARHQRKPVLGICLGMQLLGEFSEEGDVEGLGLLPAHFAKFDPADMGGRLPVPHMGWNTVATQRSHPLFNDLPEDCRFYFVHSYYAITKDPRVDVTKTLYGLDFVSSYAHDNIMGVQFHPEKSHKFGMRLFQNFAAFSRARKELHA